MGQWKTITEFYNVQDAYMARTKLEMEGFEVLLLDENSSQTMPFQNAIAGGVRFQVREEHAEAAFAKLIELECIPAPKTKKSFFSQIDHVTRNIPILNSMPVEVRFLLLASLVGLSVIIPLVLLL